MEDEEKPPTLASRMWREVRWPLVGVTLFLMGLVMVWALWPDLAPAGTGFGAYNEEALGPRSKTLWDWLGLLIVPLAVAAGAAFISYFQKRTELDIAEKARKEDGEIARQARESEQQIANDRLRQATLEGYYDRMTELLLEHGLRESAEDSEVRSIARARTVAVVRSLDGERNNQLLAFLRTSKLIESDDPIIDFSGTSLRRADLNNADLSGVNLSGANLSGANLREANLFEADLRYAALFNADLFGVDLRGANLCRADLSDAVVNGALVGANLNEAELLGTDLIGANLSGANLSKAILIEAVIMGAWLNGADLRQANLSGVRLNNTDLTEANLTGAKKWTFTQLKQANPLTAAIMPDGTQLKGPGNDGPTFDKWKVQYFVKRSKMYRRRRNHPTRKIKPYMVMERLFIMGQYPSGFI